MHTTLVLSNLFEVFYYLNLILTHFVKNIIFSFLNCRSLNTVCWAQACGLCYQHSLFFITLPMAKDCTAAVVFEGIIPAAVGGCHPTTELNGTCAIKRIMSVFTNQSGGWALRVGR